MGLLELRAPRGRVEEPESLSQKTVGWAAARAAETNEMNTSDEH
jgi:hypothetical protein